MTGKDEPIVPNMSQRAVMQYLSLDEWKVVAHLPIPAGEMMLSRILDYGWIESRVEKKQTAVRLTLALRRCGWPSEPIRRLVEIGLTVKVKK